MATMTSKKSPKVATKTTVKRVAAKAANPRTTAPRSRSRKPAKPKLLSGGNPQIAKADGDALAFFRGASLRPVPPRRVQAPERALPRHPRGRPARRGATRRVGEAGQPAARLGQGLTTA